MNIQDDKPFLIISDTQWPYEAKKALPFCKYLKRHYKVPDENCLHVGDEADQLYASMHPRDPDAPESYSAEIRKVQYLTEQWSAVFPQMKIATSNHMLRLMKKAFHADIPSQVIKPYREIIGAPEAWRWEDEWIIRTKSPFRMIHGLGYSGMNGARTAAIDGGISTAIGHLHSHAGIQIVSTSGGRQIWGMNTGCLIDVDSFAFKYGKWSRFKPALGAAVVVNRGSTPIWHPYDPSLLPKET